MSHDAFDTEFGGLARDLQDELLAHARLPADFGPNLGRPRSRHHQGFALRQHDGATVLLAERRWGGWPLHSIPAQGRGTRNETDLT